MQKCESYLTIQTKGESLYEDRGQQGTQDFKKHVHLKLKTRDNTRLKAFQKTQQNDSYELNTQFALPALKHVLGNKYKSYHLEKLNDTLTS